MSVHILWVFTFWIIQFCTHWPLYLLNILLCLTHYYVMYCYPFKGIIHSFVWKTIWLLQLHLLFLTYMALCITHYNTFFSVFWIPSISLHCQGLPPPNFTALSMHEILYPGLSHCYTYISVEYFLYLKTVSWIKLWYLWWYICLCVIMVSRIFSLT